MNKNVLSIFFSLVIITNVYAQQESKKDETYWGTLKKGASATYDYMTNTATQASKWIKENPRKSLGALLLAAWGGHALYEWHNAPIDLAHFNNFDIEPVNLDLYDRNLRHTHHPHDGFDNPKNDASFIAAIPMPIHGEMFMHDGTIFGHSSSHTCSSSSSSASSKPQLVLTANDYRRVAGHCQQVNVFFRTHQIQVSLPQKLQQEGLPSPIIIKNCVWHAAERNIMGDATSATHRKVVSVNDIVDALTNPLSASRGNLPRRIKQEGQYATVIFDTDGNLITVMPTHRARVKKLTSIKNAPQPTLEKKSMKTCLS